MFTQRGAEQKRPNAQRSSSGSWHLVVPTEKVEGCCRVSVCSVSIFPNIHSAVHLVDECMHCIPILNETFQQLFFTTVVKDLANLIPSSDSVHQYMLLIHADKCTHAQSNVFKVSYTYINILFSSRVCLEEANQVLA